MLAEDDYGDESKRKTRNLSEKKRRDQFNILVNELNSMISTGNRKLDKSTVLKSTISFLKNQNEIAVRSRVNEIQDNWKPSFLSNEEFSHLILEALDGFIIVFTSTGKIKFASESITSLLGYLPSEILNTSIYDITFDDDKPNLFNLLQSSVGPGGVPCEDKDSQVMFACHLKREGIDNRDDATYELIHFTGYYRSKEAMLNYNRQYIIDIEEESQPLSIFICTGRLQTPQLIRDLTLVDTSKNEFTSRHSLEWKFLFLDHRASPIIGYMPFEVLGTSGYDYYHFDDLDKVVLCHEALILKGEGTSCYYRFLTKGQQWIWLQTRFYITYHQWNSKPEFIVCTHRVVRYQDVIKSERKSNEYYHPAISITDGNNDRYFEGQSNPYMPQTEVSNYQYNMWEKRISKTTKFNTNADPAVYNPKFARHPQNIRGTMHGSDTASISAESLTSRKSSTQQNSCSVIMHAGTVAMQHNQCMQQTETVSQQQPHQQPHQQSHQQPHQLQTMQHIHNIHQIQQQPPQQQPQQHQPLLDVQHQQQQIVPDQMIVQYREPQPYVMPLQPIVNNVDVRQVSTIKDDSQEQKKHDELKELIRLQKEELRRVSEQLIMARYGLLPPIINMAAPYNSILQTENSVTWSETTETYPQEMYHHALPAPMNHGQIILHTNQQPIADQPNFVPMQMSQHQAQLLFQTDHG